MSNDETRRLAESDQLDELLEADQVRRMASIQIMLIRQLMNAMAQGEAFEGYEEGPITFR